MENMQLHPLLQAAKLARSVGFSNHFVEIEKAKFVCSNSEKCYSNLELRILPSNIVLDNKVLNYIIANDGTKGFCLVKINNSH